MDYGQPHEILVARRHRIAGSSAELLILQELGCFVGNFPSTMQTTCEGRKASSIKERQKRIKLYIFLCVCMPTMSIFYGNDATCMLQALHKKTLLWSPM